MSQSYDVDLLILDLLENMSLINDSNKVVQAIDFSGVQNKNMHPSDIDAVLEFDNKLLILMEIKIKGKQLPTGQKLMLQRICDAWDSCDNKNGLVLKIEHNHYTAKTDIPLRNCVVTEIYFQGQWSKRKQKLITCLNDIGKYYKIDKCSF